jgi:threo-3-hydroxy-L-aspartate ammonia-lyase
MWVRAALLGVRTVVVVPSTVPKVKAAAIERYGTELVMAEPTLAAASGWPGPPPTSSARSRTALRVEQVGALPFAHIRELVTDIITVTEDEILTAVRRLGRCG